MTLAARLQAQGLTLLGQARDGAAFVALLGPDEPGFWPLFSASREYGNGAPDPLDRWSKRVIGTLANELGVEAVFPSDGPPYPPFLQWARDSGRCHVSPVGLLVHDRAGLWLSFRGALLLPRALEMPRAQPSPCIGCARPCLAACPAGALGRAPYDVAACHAWLDQPAGDACMEAGCAVRRACPVGAAYGRVAAQSAFHMKAFHQ